MVHSAKQAWVAWLRLYGAGRFYTAFMRVVQGAESECVHCGEKIYLDISEGGGVPDWKTRDGDYGCNDSPETTAEGTGSHEASGTRCHCPSGQERT